MPIFIAQNDRITIRKMEPTPEDYNLFLKWMTDPETMKYWDGMTEIFTYEKVAEHYRSHIEEHVEQCIIEYQQVPIGFCQYCVVDAEEYEIPVEKYNEYIDDKEKVYGIDIFIGAVEQRNRGLGTMTMKLLMQSLFETQGADVILIDPKTHNARAIRCYHKCGFQDLFVVSERELQDGIYHDSLIMGIKKEAFQSMKSRETE